jgi:hypothetical protein
MITAGQLMELLGTLEDISRPLPTKSWMQIDDDVLHDIRIIRNGDALTIIAESQAAKTWLNNLQNDILPALTWKLKLMTPEDIRELDESLTRQPEQE